MSDTTLTVDVIIPCWGEYSQYLIKAILSAKTATNIIVVGDEAAIKIAQTCGVESVEIGGLHSLSSARQQGLLFARSDSVCFLDADDEFKQDGLNYLKSLFERHPEAIAVTSRLGGTEKNHFWPPNFRARIACSKFGGPILLFKNSFVVNGSCLIRRASIVGKTIYPELENEDWHAAIALKQLGNIVYNPKVTVTYRMWQGSISRRKRDIDAIRKSDGELLQTAFKFARRPLIMWPLLETVAVPFRKRRFKQFLQ